MAETIQCQHRHGLPLVFPNACMHSEAHTQVHGKLERRGAGISILNKYPFNKDLQVCECIYEWFFVKGIHVYPICACCLRRPGEGAAFPGTGVLDGFKLACVCWEPNPCSLKSSILKYWAISAGPILILRKTLPIEVMFLNECPNYRVTFFFKKIIYRWIVLLFLLFFLFTEEGECFVV